MHIILPDKNNYKKNLLNVFVFFLITFFYAMLSAYAKESPQGSVLAIPDIEVYAEGESLDEAKEKAIKEGSSKALQIFLTTISTYENRLKIPALINRIEADDLIDDTYPINERMTSHSYKATITYKFNDRKVRNLLNSLGIKYSGRDSLNVLLIPILHQKTGQLVIWSQGEWRSAWEAIPDTIGLIHFNLTEGDLEDLDIIDPEEVLVKPYKDYESFLKTYNAEIMVSILATELDNKLDITLRFLSLTNDYFKYITIAKGAKEDDSEFYHRVAAEIASRIDAEWKGNRVFDKERYYVSNLIVRYNNPNQWLTIQKHLEKIKAITQITLISKGAQQAEIEIIYTLAPAILSKLISHKGYSLEEKNNGIYLTAKQEVKAD